MITINLKQKTKKNGQLVIDVPTTLINKTVDIILVIQEEEAFPKNDEEGNTKKKYDFSHLYGKLEWKGDALAEQKKIRSEWK
ncbi:MAG: hypothetical protein ABI760_08775 [Ferruginibacter sp.]